VAIRNTQGTRLRLVVPKPVHETKPLCTSLSIRRVFDMPKMFEIGNQILRESARQLDRDSNTATVTLTLEPKLGELVPYQRDNQKVQFSLMVDRPDIWDTIKDASP